MLGDSITTPFLSITLTTPFPAPPFPKTEEPGTITLISVFDQERIYELSTEKNAVDEVLFAFLNCTEDVAAFSLNPNPVIVRILCVPAVIETGEK